MNFELFESMTPDTARDALRQFLQTEKLAIEAMREKLQSNGCALSFELESLSADLKCFLRQVRVRSFPVPASEPEWVKAAHKTGIHEFEEDSKAIVLAAAYLLGESFVRANNAMEWGIGNPEYIEKNMPVVKGFRRGHELASIMVVENIFLRILGDGAPLTDIDKMVQAWPNRMP